MCECVCESRVSECVYECVCEFVCARRSLSGGVLVCVCVCVFDGSELMLGHGPGADTELLVEHVNECVNHMCESESE